MFPYTDPVTETKTPRTATAAVAASFTPDARIHLATRKNGGWVLGCNGRFMAHASVWTGATDVAKVMSGAFACARCVAGLANGRITVEAQS